MRERAGQLSMGVLIIAVVSVVIGIGFFPVINGVTNTIFEDFLFSESTTADFSDGTFVNTTTSNDIIFMTGNNTTGTYSSNIESVSSPDIDLQSFETDVFLATTSNGVNATLQTDSNTQVFQLSNGTNTFTLSGYDDPNEFVRIDYEMKRTLNTISLGTQTVNFDDFEDADVSDWNLTQQGCPSCGIFPNQTIVFEGSWSAAVNVSDTGDASVADKVTEIEPQQFDTFSFAGTTSQDGTNGFGEWRIFDEAGHEVFNLHLQNGAIGWNDGCGGASVGGQSWTNQYVTVTLENVDWQAKTFDIVLGGAISPDQTISDEPFCSGLANNFSRFEIRNNYGGVTGSQTVYTDGIEYTYEKIENRSEKSPEINSYTVEGENTSENKPIANLIGTLFLIGVAFAALRMLGIFERFG